MIQTAIALLLVSLPALHAAPEPSQHRLQDVLNLVAAHTGQPVFIDRDLRLDNVVHVARYPKTCSRYASSWT